METERMLDGYDNPNNSHDHLQRPAALLNNNNVNININFHNNDYDDDEDGDGNTTAKDSLSITADQFIHVTDSDLVQSAWVAFFTDRHLKSMLSAYILTVITSFCYAIFLPTMPLLLKQMGSDSLVLGFTMSAYHLSALLVAWAVLRWSRHRSLFPPLIVCCVVSIIGFLIYFCVAHPWAVFVSRVIVGAGSNTITLSSEYLHRAVTLEDRKTAMSRIVFCGVAGMIIGSLAASACAAIDFQLGVLNITNYSSPGFICAVLAFANLLQIIVLFRDPLVDHRGVVDTGFSIERTQANTVIGASLWILLWFICNAVSANFEVLNTLFAAEELGWDEFLIGLIWAASGCVSLLVVTMHGNQVTLFSERTLFYACLVILTASQALLVHWNIGPIHFLQYFAGVLLMSLGYNLERIFTYSLLTTLLGEGYKGKLLKIYHLSGRIAPVLISPASGAIYNYVDPDASWVASYLVMCFALVLAIVGYFLLFHRSTVNDVSFRDDVSMPSTVSYYAAQTNLIPSEATSNTNASEEDFVEPPVNQSPWAHLSNSTTVTGSGRLRLSSSSHSFIRELSATRLTTSDPSTPTIDIDMHVHQQLANSNDSDSRDIHGEHGENQQDDDDDGAGPVDDDQFDVWLQRM